MWLVVLIVFGVLGFFGYKLMMKKRDQKALQSDEMQKLFKAMLGRFEMGTQESSKDCVHCSHYHDMRVQNEFLIKKLEECRATKLVGAGRKKRKAEHSSKVKRKVKAKNEDTSNDAA